MDKTRAKQLLEKYRLNTLTDEERGLLESWYLNWPAEEEHDLTESEIDGELEIMRASNPFLAHKQRSIKIWPRVGVAASLLVFISIAGYFLLNRKSAQNQTAQILTQQIIPGSNQATLTLSNGHKILITKKLRGQIAMQGNTSIQANSGDAITYTAQNATNTTNKIEYNTLSTSKGESSPFPLILADGTEVWLNAASSIKFPTSFSGKERMVKITGEAYLEVIHNAVHPFRVEVNEQIIEDVGTHFNINSYADEPQMTTTLVEGAVKISTGNQIAYLKPGQQAVMKSSALSIMVNPADVDQAIAWKNGDFAFEGTPLRVIMRQISRWYDVDISYKGAIADVEFGGSISRSKNINEVLNVLESTQSVHFKIEGRRILVMP